jgi:hypothetical protein
MPIYEYYCPDNHTIYQFYAKTVAQGQTTPKCPDNPGFQLKKIVSAFAITSAGEKDEIVSRADNLSGDPRLEAAMGAMEKDFATLDDNDPKAVARMMRRMSELTGEKMGGVFEEVVRKIEEGADPDSLEEQLGAEMSPHDSADPSTGGNAQAKALRERRLRLRARQLPARRDPKLYDFE